MNEIWDILCEKDYSLQGNTVRTSKLLWLFWKILQRSRGSQKNSSAHLFLILLTSYKASHTWDECLWLFRTDGNLPNRWRQLFGHWMSLAEMYVPSTNSSLLAARILMDPEAFWYIGRCHSNKTAFVLSVFYSHKLLSNFSILVKHGQVSKSIFQLALIETTIKVLKFLVRDWETSRKTGDHIDVKLILSAEGRRGNTFTWIPMLYMWRDIIWKIFSFKICSYHSYLI